MPDLIRPLTYVALRLPSESLVVLEVVPNTTISIGKYGSFQANHIIGRPFHLTFDILDKIDASNTSSLRLVPAADLYADIIEDEDTSPPNQENGRMVDSLDGVEYQVLGQDGEVVLRTNKNILDDSGTQSMTMDEIEALKIEGAGSGKDLIAKLLESHSELDQKTAFALAKYTLKKERKFMKRFTVLPLDVSTLTRWILLEKEPMKIMELREEMIALIGSWANIHHVAPDRTSQLCEGPGKSGAGRWLMIDETGGLLVAAVAERMGLLDSLEATDQETERQGSSLNCADSSQANGFLDNSDNQGRSHSGNPQRTAQQKSNALSNVNTITLIHANAQPNLSLLRYFNFDASNPASLHPMQRHLRTISWLQLLSPEDDNGYAEPEAVSDEILQSWKSGKRGNYYRKRRRWERIKFIVDETRDGDFDGLVIASVMNLPTILHHGVPLLRGGAQVVIYSPTVEPLVELADYYSTARRTAFVTSLPNLPSLPTDDFPVNPTLLLAPTIQTVRCKSWQVLPGRTHPHMTGRGGSEGYLFTATRVLPAEGKIEARGNFKRRKITGLDDIMTPGSQDQH
ncbi:tRNA (adenine(58)-N(1))-methyltransferase non-catalytic subunit trm6 [Pseudocyphellaria aurata]|nr:tRNA (adenine(58)-N(1))-methyltransferase non-catalytic subunit trm6 [Pseudocyphellaria aurata]